MFFDFEKIYDGSPQRMISLRAGVCFVISVSHLNTMTMTKRLKLKWQLFDLILHRHFRDREMCIQLDLPLAVFKHNEIVLCLSTNHTLALLYLAPRNTER